MKFVRSAATAVLLGVACLARADADPASPSSTPAGAASDNSEAQDKPETQKVDLSKSMLLPDADNRLEIQPSSPASGVNATPGTSADAILDNEGDLPAIRSAPHKQTQGEIEATLQREAESEKDNDWLVRDYEQQLQSRVGKTSEDQSTNLYYQLASDKNLAKLAGISPLEIPAEDPTATPRLGTDDSDKGALVLRKDPSQEKTKSDTTDITVFKPLINPETPVFTSASNNAYTSLSYAASRLFPPDNSTAVDSTERTSDVTIPTDIETPGLVAAKSDPLATAIDADDSEYLSQPQPLPQDPDALDRPPSLPPDTASAQLLKNYHAALSATGSLEISEPQQLVNPITVKLPDNAEPVVKVAQPTPVRRPIANPLVIPYR